MSFRRTVEDFTCERCGTFHRGNGYTNHCRVCLHSKHVDESPGDRASVCGGSMAPVDLLLIRGEHVLVHECQECGAVRRCRVSPRDDLSVAMAAARRTAEAEVTGRHRRRLRDA